MISSNKVQEALAACEAGGAKELNLSGCGLRDLSSIKDHIPSQLETLDLTKNVLTDIDNGIFQLTKLRHLFLGYNKIESIPPYISQLQELRTLSVKRNSITTIPDEIGDLPKLRILNISHNKLTTVPAAVGNLSELTEFIIYGNQFQSLPESLSNLVCRIDTDDARLLVPVFSTDAKWKSGSIDLPESLRTPIIQYLQYFNDFYYHTKGSQLAFEVVRTPTGLCIRTKNDDITIIESSLRDYLNCIKTINENLEFSIENIKPRNLDEVKNILFIQELKNQIQFLKIQLEGKNVAVQILNQQLDRVSNIALSQATRPLTLQISNHVSQLNGDYVRSHPVLSANLEKAIDILSQIRGVARDSFVENEVEKLTAYVQDARNSNSKEEFEKKGLKEHLMRFIEKASDATTNIGEAMTKIGEIYDKLATLKDVVINLLTK
jgi:Leucine-rich repeat (LRR) protein